MLGLGHRQDRRRALAAWLVHGLPPQHRLDVQCALQVCIPHQLALSRKVLAKLAQLVHMLRLVLGRVQLVTLARIRLWLAPLHSQTVLHVAQAHMLPLVLQHVMVAMLALFLMLRQGPRRVLCAAPVHMLVRMQQRALHAVLVVGHPLGHQLVFPVLPVLGRQ